MLYTIASFHRNFEIRSTNSTGISADVPPKVLEFSRGSASKTAIESARKHEAIRVLDQLFVS